MAQTVSKTPTREIERLPIEYPIRKAIVIYTKRLGIFSAIVSADFLLLGFVLILHNSLLYAVIIATTGVTLLYIIVRISKSDGSPIPAPRARVVKPHRRDLRPHRGAAVTHDRDKKGERRPRLHHGADIHHGRPRKQ